MLSPLTGADRLAQEKARLEAFLNAFPGEYCGFHKDGSVAYSEGFCALFGLSAIAAIEDVQAAIAASDSAALEGQFLALENEGKSFSLLVRTEGKKRIVRLRGQHGAASDKSDSFCILWAEDVTDSEDGLARQKQAREAAESRLSLLESALSALPHPAWLRNGAQALIWVNPAYENFVRASGDAIAAQTEIIFTKGGKPPRDLAGEALATGESKTARGHAVAGGKRRLLEITERPLPGSHHTLGLAFDLTREEDVQTELERHTSANRNLLEYLRSAIAIFGADQSLTFFNTAFAALWSLEEAYLNTRPKFGDILEKLRAQRLLPEQADFRQWKQGWLDFFTRLIEPQEDMMYLPDGRAVRILIVPHTLGGLMVVCEDVTSHLQLESSYNTLMAVQKETLDNLAEGIAVYGGDGKLRLFNPSFARLWGLKPDILAQNTHISRIVSDMVSSFPPVARTDAQDELMAHGLERAEHSGRLALDGHRYFGYATVPLPDGGVMVSYHDITDSAQVEHALREKNAALEAAEKLKADFLANVSYQLRTPLNAIMGFADILNNQYFGPLTDKQGEYARGITEAGGQLVRLIDDILDLASIEAGYLELRKESVAVRELLEGLATLTNGWARNQKLAIDLHCPRDIGQINADPARLKQIILNILRNAISHTPEGGTIEIQAEKSGDSVKITVRDTGIGIPEQDLDRVFQAFERTRAGKGKQGQSGAGLGLALVKNIAELHNGYVTIHSREGEGTAVALTLPIR